MKTARFWIIFWHLFLISYFPIFSNSLIIFERSFSLTFLMAYLAFLYFGYLYLVFISRAVNNPFRDLSNFSFDSEYLVSILFRLSNFAKMCKVTILLLPLISLCFLSLRRPKLFMFKDRHKSFLPVNFSSQNFFRVEQPW